MKYKDPHIRDDYNNISLKPSRENAELRVFLEWLEKLSVMLGFGELTMTDYLRDDPHSLHHYGQAADIRVWDKPAIWYWTFCLIGMAIGMLNPRFRINPHHEQYNKFVARKGGAQPHLHVEVRTKKNA